MIDEPRARAFWEAYRAAVPDRPSGQVTVDHFCDNATDADALAQLALDGTKRGTASSVAELEAAGAPIPAVGDHLIVTDWAGTPVCIVRTTRVDILPFAQVTAAFAAVEGEGDGSLAHWRRVHRAYYQRVLTPLGLPVTDDLLVVCERFERVYPPAPPMNAA